MLRPDPDRALRKLVMQLAIADPDDIKVVLDGLEPSRAAAVRTLLDEYAGVRPVAPSVGGRGVGGKGDDVAKIRGLSPWLADRIAETSLAAAGSSRLTPAALTALRAAALSVREGQR